MLVWDSVLLWQLPYYSLRYADKHSRSTPLLLLVCNGVCYVGSMRLNMFGCY
jgi:hypothetical protein